MPRRALSNGSPNSAASRILWEKKRSRHPRIDDDASRVPLGHQPPHPLCLSAETQFVAQSNRNLLGNPPTKMPARRQLHLGGRPRIPTPTVHHLLQHDNGSPLQLDRHRQTAPEETPPPFRPASSAR